MRLLTAFLLLALTACPASQPPGPPPEPPPGTVPADLPPGGEAGAVRLPSSLAPEDFIAFFPASKQGALLDAAGTFGGTVESSASGLVFIVPKEGSATARKLAPETGLFASPVAGVARVTGSPPYALSDSGPITIDARTTMLSLVLLHPSLSHPDASVTRQQLVWLLDAVSRPWAEFDNAARMYGEQLEAGADPFAYELFTTALADAITYASQAMPVYAPVPQQGQPLVAGTQAQPGEVVASTVGFQQTSAGQSLLVDTRNGTGLDYHYEIRPLDQDSFPDWVLSGSFIQYDSFTQLSGGAVMARGVAGSKSYARYADPLGTFAKYVSSQIAGAVTGGGLAMPADRAIYEVRLFSGGFGNISQARRDFLDTYYQAETRAATLHNVAMAVFEGVSLVPGADLLFGEEAGKKALEAVVLQLTQGIEALISSKGITQVTMGDLYELGVTTIRAGVDKLVDVPREQLEEAGWKKVVGFFKAGGSRAVKFVTQVPGKLAGGGALAHRLARLVGPESVAESWLVAIDPNPPTRLERKLTMTVPTGIVSYELQATLVATGEGITRLADSRDEWHHLAAVFPGPASLEITYDAPPTPSVTAYTAGQYTCTITSIEVSSYLGCDVGGAAGTGLPIVPIQDGLRCGAEVPEVIGETRGAVVVGTRFDVIGTRDWIDEVGTPHHEADVLLGFFDGFGGMLNLY